MKRILKTLSVAILILIIPLSTLFGQDKKNEQKVKIIVNDGSGAKVMIDTVFRGDQGPDSLTLKDGSVVHLRQHGGDKHFTITYSSDDNDGDGLTKEMTVISSDSMDTKNDEHGNVMYYRNDRDGNHRYRVEKRISRDGDDNDDMMYIRKARQDREEEMDSDSNVDKTRFVIAKDGMVVTIEGTDEAKAKELAGEIEKRLGVNSKEEKKEVTKTKTEKKVNK